MVAVPLVEVAAGIVRTEDGRVLLAERTARQIAAGFWELPGGKIDAGETPAEAAARELHEEIGIEARALRPWIVYDHTFRTKRVRLHFFRVDAWNGTPRGREGQRLAWVDPAAPRVAPLLPSNERVLAALGLPPLYFMPALDRTGGPRDLLDAVAGALASGIRLIGIDDVPLAAEQRSAFARKAVALARPYGGRVLLSGTALEAGRAGADGVQSCACRTRRAAMRPPVPVWAASCRSETELAHAVRLGADLAVVPDVLAPGDDGAALGWEGLRRLASSAPIPLYAAGGVTDASLADALRAGAAGVVVTAPLR
jgi:8-oxo-dGTP diphosphatase